MYNYELLAKLRNLTLTVNNDAEYWEEKLEFIGTDEQWDKALDEELELCQ